MTTQVADKTEKPTDRATPEQRRSIFASTVGQVLEWYEWSAYAVFAPFIARALFNQDNPVSALLSTFAVFAVGFLMRPLGGLVFGIIADKKGRKFVLIVTMLSMALASTAIGLMPTFQSVGIWASVGLLSFRMIQGFAHGGESAAAFSYVGEIAPKRKRGFWGSSIFVGVYGGAVLAYSIGGVITTGLPQDSVADWGWRIPFLLGAVFAILALWLRTRMMESDVFANPPEELLSRDDSASSSAEKLAARAGSGHPRSLLKTALLFALALAGLHALGHSWLSYASTYAISQKGMLPQSAYWAMLVAQAAALIAVPLWGKLSDIIGRKPVMWGTSAAMCILQFPLMGMITDQFWTLAVAATIALLIVSSAGYLAAYMSELFPVGMRTRTIGLVYGGSVALFGGTAPYLYQLFNSLNVGWMSHVWVIFLLLITILIVNRLPETRGIELR